MADQTSLLAGCSGSMVSYHVWIKETIDREHPDFIDVSASLNSRIELASRWLLRSRFTVSSLVTIHDVWIPSPGGQTEVTLLQPYKRAAALGKSEVLLRLIGIPVKVPVNLCSDGIDLMSPWRSSSHQLKDPSNSKVVLGDIHNVRENILKYVKTHSSSPLLHLSFNFVCASTSDEVDALGFPFWLGRGSSFSVILHWTWTNFAA